MRTHLRRLSLVCTALLTLGAVPAARAQSSSDADMKAVDAYRLSMDAFAKVARVNRVVDEEMLKDPTMRELMKLKGELKALKAKEELSEADYKRGAELEGRIEALDQKVSRTDNGMSSAKSLTEMTRAFERTPTLVSALKREGMSPREYATFMLASLQASMTAGLMSSNAGIDRSKLTANQLANAKFVQEHQAEIGAMFPGGGKP